MKTNQTKDKLSLEELASYKDFSHRLTYVMKIQGIKCTELAAKVYLSPSTISCYRQGARDPSSKDLANIAKALDVSTDYLVGRTNILVSYSIIEKLLNKYFKPVGRQQK